MSLTLRCIVLILGIVLLAIIGQWSSSSLSGIWRYPAALLIISLLVEGLRARLNPVPIKRVLEQKVAMGEDQPLQIEITNLSRRDLHMQTQARYSAALFGDESVQSWRVAAKSSCLRVFQVTPLFLGKTTIGEFYTRSLGYLGLAWWTQATGTQEREQVLVVPRALSHNESAKGIQLNGERYTRQQFSSGDNLLALRDYQFGDPIKAIDWKATAKRGQAMVRIFEHEQSLDLMLVVDCGRSSRIQSGKLSRLNHSINIAARLSQYAISHGDQVGVIGFSNQRLEAVPLGHGERAMQRIRASLSNLRSRDEDFNPIAAALELQKLLRQRSLVVFLSEMEQREAAEQLAKACKMLSGKHLVVVSSLIDSEIQAYQSRDGSHWLDPYRRYAANEFLSSQKYTALHLRRLGAEVVLGTPDSLDYKVMRSYQYLRNRQKV